MTLVDSTAVQSVLGTNWHQEQDEFLPLCKGASSSESTLTQLIELVLNKRTLFVYGELISELSKYPMYAALKNKPGSCIKKLELFAFGSVLSVPADIVLSAGQLWKLRLLTLLGVCAPDSRDMMVSYEVLVRELKLAGDGHQNEAMEKLHDLVLEALEFGIIRGTLDQKQRCLVIREVCLVRDSAILLEQAKLIETFQSWLKDIDSTIGLLTNFRDTRIRQLVHDKKTDLCDLDLKLGMTLENFKSATLQSAMMNFIPGAEVTSSIDFSERFGIDREGSSGSMSRGYRSQEYHSEAAANNRRFQ